jgi:hypothetical protein
MSFLSPKVPEPKIPPTVKQPTDTSVGSEQSPAGYASLMATGAQGLKRKASTVKSSLMGGTIS